MRGRRLDDHRCGAGGLWVLVALLANLHRAGAGAAGFESNCTWPQCTLECEPCRTRRVGTCIAKTIGIQGQDCQAERSECIIGRCICMDGFCAGQNDDTCEQQNCTPGARPPPYRPGVWVSLFAASGTEEEFPPLEEIHDRWLEYVIPSCRTSISVLVLGALVALSMVLITCFGDRLDCLCCFRSSRVSDSILCALVLTAPEQDETDGDTGSEARRPPLRDDAGTEPTALPMLLTTAGVLLLSVVGIFVRQQGWHKTVWIVNSCLNDGYNDSLHIVDHVELLNETITTIEESFLGMQECQHNPLMKAVGANALDMAQDYIGILEKLYADVQPMPGAVKDLSRQVHEQEVYGIWLPNAPQILMSIMCSLIVLEALASRKCLRTGPHPCIRCTEVTAITLFVLVILVVSICIACEVQFAVGSSQICFRLDERLLNFLDLKGQDFNMSDLYDTGRFYLRGDIYNPLFRYTDTAIMYVDQITDLYDEFKVHLDVQALSCQALNDLNATSITSKAHTLMEFVRQALLASNVYPYYKRIVRDGLCDHILPSVGCLISFQMSISFIGFPVCAVLAHRYLLDRHAYGHAARAEEDRGGAEEGRDVDDQESAEEGKSDDEESGQWCYGRE